MRPFVALLFRAAIMPGHRELTARRNRPTMEAPYRRCPHEKNETFARQSLPNPG